ncbi:MAG: hypothetical protein ACE5GS_09185 [Kiloniellaceae bacterium]
MWTKGIALAGAFVLLTACTTPLFTMPPGPKDYRVGYQEGCDAGYAYAGSPLYSSIDKAEPPRTDQPYLTGWQSGFERCKRNYQRIQATVSSILGPP